MYFVWALLPITLFFMSVWSFLKPYLKVYGKEDTKRYFMMFVFCSVVMFFAVQVDKGEYLKELIPKISLGLLDYSVVRIVIYPAMLYLATVIWDYYDAKNKQKQAQKNNNYYR